MILPEQSCANTFGCFVKGFPSWVSNHTASMVQDSIRCSVDAPNDYQEDGMGVRAPIERPLARWQRYSHDSPDLSRQFPMIEHLQCGGQLNG
jgi:hypothetical protein